MSKKEKPVENKPATPRKPQYGMFSIYMRAKNRKGEYLWN